MNDIRMNLSYVGTDTSGRHLGKRCKNCRHLTIWHFERRLIRDKTNGYCGAFGCLCNVSAEQL